MSQTLVKPVYNGRFQHHVGYNIAYLSCVTVYNNLVRGVLCACAGHRCCSSEGGREGVAVGDSGSSIKHDISNYGTSRDLEVHKDEAGKCQSSEVVDVASTVSVGPNYARNKRNRERRKKRISSSLVSEVSDVVGTIESVTLEDSRKKIIDLEVAELRLKREKEQLAISQAFRERQEQQAEISRLFRIKQERIENDTVSVVAQMEIDRNKKLLEKLRVEQQLKVWDHSVEAVNRRKKEIVARSELNIAKYENMKERRSKLQEIERNENWREGASGGGSLPPSAVSSKPSIPSSVSARSSASQVVASSSASSVYSGKSKVSNSVAERLRTIQRKSELLTILDSDGEFLCGADESEARLYDMDRDAVQRAKARKLAEAKISVKKGWF